MTLVHKRLFPLLWFGGLLFILLGDLSDGAGWQDPELLVLPLAVGVVGFAIFRVFVWNLADEVDDFGGYLVVRRGAQEARIALEDIVDITCPVLVNPQRITLRLAAPCALGDTLHFLPKLHFSLNPVARSPVFLNLKERVGAAQATPGPHRR
jgi:hypothetical protein